MEHRESCDQEQKPPAGLVHASLMLAVLLDVFGANPSGMYLSLGNYGGVLASEAACAIVICPPLWRYYVRYGRRGLAAAGTSVPALA